MLGLGALGYVLPYAEPILVPLLFALLLAMLLIPLINRFTRLEKMNPMHCGRSSR